MGGDAARLVAKFDGWTLWRTPLELFRGDQPVRLQEQPLQILEALLRKPGELVTREELTAQLWPDSVVDFEAGLNTAVRKLRVALADDAEAPKYVETVPRQGYRFIGPIERRDDGAVTEGPRASGPAWRVDAALAGATAGRRPSWSRAGLALSASRPLLLSPSRSSRPTRPPAATRRALCCGHRLLASRCCRSRT